MAAKPKPRFEDALAQVESMVSALESGEVPLEEAIASYEKGLKAIQSCYEILDKAEVTKGGVRASSEDDAETP